MNYSELVARDVKDLRMLAAQYGIKVHHKAKAETIAKLIVEHVTEKPKESLKHVAEKPKPAEVIHTPEEVNEVIKAFSAKEGYVVEYPGDDTWIFKYKGAEESGHMSTPLRVIRMKAESVSRGARRIVTVKNENGQDVMMV
jgi:hypothetical protein